MNVVSGLKTDARKWERNCTVCMLGTCAVSTVCCNLSIPFAQLTTQSAWSYSVNSYQTFLYIFVVDHVNYVHWLSVHVHNMSHSMLQTWHPDTYATCKRSVWRQSDNFQASWLGFEIGKIKENKSEHSTFTAHRTDNGKESRDLCGPRYSKWTVRLGAHLMFTKVKVSKVQQTGLQTFANNVCNNFTQLLRKHSYTLDCLHSKAVVLK